jgi:hypothetical protein
MLNLATFHHHHHHLMFIFDTGRKLFKVVFINETNKQKQAVASQAEAVK